MSSPLPFTRTVTFNNGNDFVYWTDASQPTIIELRDGNDLFFTPLGFQQQLQIIGGAGQDYLFSSASFSSLIGGAGDDVLVVNDTTATAIPTRPVQPAPAAHTLLGEAGNDALFGGILPSLLSGGDGNDILVGQNSYDTLIGGAGDDGLWGALGDDTLEGGAGNDRLIGGAGNDTLRSDEGNDLLWGEAGDDTLLANGSGNVMLDGGEGNDLLTAGLGQDSLFGGDGDDILANLGRGDYAVGGAGADIFRFGDLTPPVGTTNLGFVLLNAETADNFEGLAGARVVQAYSHDAVDTALLDVTGDAQADVAIVNYGAMSLQELVSELAAGGANTDNVMFG